jgi:hypothetical protein
MVGELTSIRVPHPFRHPRSREAKAHQAVFDLATMAVVLGGRGKLTEAECLTLSGYESLLNERERCIGGVLMGLVV